MNLSDVEFLDFRVSIYQIFIVVHQIMFLFSAPRPAFFAVPSGRTVEERLINSEGFRENLLENL